MVLRLFDPARGAVDDVRPAVTRVLRIGAGDGVRVAIVADLLRRLAERERWQTAVFGTSSLTDRQLLYLNVHPFHEPGPEVQLSVRDVDALSAPGRNVPVAGPLALDPPAGLDPPADLDPPTDLAPPAELESPGLQPPADLAPPAELESPGLQPPAGLDPLAVRLALLRVPYRTPAALGPDDLTAAARDLDRWRGLVAAWAEHPSAPIAGEHAVVERLQDDLDTPGALAALDALAADDSVPRGARFEAFAHLDRLLGLDLAAEVGRPR